MNYQQGPTYRETTMASFLKGLAEANPDSVPSNVMQAANETLQWSAGLARDNLARRLREEQRAETAAQVLASDVAIPAGVVKPCQVRVYRGSRDFRGGACSHKATHVRSWTTNQFDHLELDGKTVEGGMVDDGWEIGKGFTKRPLSEEENARAERIYRTDTHTMDLCGTHRRKRGEYGMPF